MTRGALPRNKWSEPVSLEGGNCGNGGLAPRSFSYLCVALRSFSRRAAARASSVRSVSMVSACGQPARVLSNYWRIAYGLGQRPGMAADGCSPDGAGSCWRPWLGVVSSNEMRVWCPAKAGGRGARPFDRFGRAIRFDWLLAPLASNKLQRAYATPSGPQLVLPIETLSLGSPPTLCADSLRGITQPRRYRGSRTNVTRETS